jgi:hypothetical protein
VNKASLKKPEVATFLEYYLEQGQVLVSEVGYVRLSEALLGQTQTALKDATGGVEAVDGE